MSGPFADQARPLRDASNVKLLGVESNNKIRVDGSRFPGGECRPSTIAPGTCGGVRQNLWELRNETRRADNPVGRRNVVSGPINSVSPNIGAFHEGFSPNGVGAFHDGPAFHGSRRWLRFQRRHQTYGNLDRLRVGLANAIPAPIRAILLSPL